MLEVLRFLGFCPKVTQKFNMVKHGKKDLKL